MLVTSETAKLQALQCHYIAYFVQNCRIIGITALLQACYILNCKITDITALLQGLLHLKMQDYRHYSVVTVPITCKTAELQALQSWYIDCYMQNCKITRITALLQSLFHPNLQNYRRYSLVTLTVSSKTAELQAL